jgi:hypothetical protein
MSPNNPNVTKKNNKKTVIVPPIKICQKRLMNENLNSGAAMISMRIYAVFYSRIGVLTDYWFS